MSVFSRKNLASLCMAVLMLSGYVFADNTKPRRDLSDPKIRQQRIEQLSQKANKDRDEALAAGADGGLGLKWKLGQNTFALIKVENGKVYTYKTNNSNAAISIGADQLHPASPYNLDGAGEIIGLWDGNAVLATHQELTGRILFSETSTLDDHSTHVAGTMIASGVQANAKGMAPAASLYSYEFDNDQPEMLGRAMVSPTTDPYYIQLSNHSYSFITGWGNSYSPPRWYGTWGDPESDMFGQYDSSASGVDEICYDAPYYLPIKAVGNDRNDSAPADGADFQYWGRQGTWKWLTKSYDSATDPPGDGWDNGGFDTVSAMGTAKNIITVGSVRDAVTSGQRDPSLITATSSFSCWGPTDDGRIKPDIVTNGEGLYSSLKASDDTSYASWSGTSMASPGACGSAALLLQYNRDLSGSTDPNDYRMLSSTIKALILHSADDRGNAGPDYKFGWGLMNIKAAADQIKLAHDYPGNTIVFEDFLDITHPTRVFPINYNSTEPIKITICWTDPAHNPIELNYDNTTKALVNDLDIRLTAPDGTTTHYPYILDPANPDTAATTGDNIRDNVEQIFIASPSQTGTYTLTVSHKSSLTNNQQDYSLIISGQSLIPDVPENLTATAGADCGKVDLVWDLANGATGYEIYYQEDSAGPPYLPTFDGLPASGTDIADANSITITNLDPGHTYYFAVIAYNDTAQSDYTNAVSAMPNSQCPVIISGTITNQSGNFVEGVTVQADNGGNTIATNSAGLYSVVVPYGWANGTITPDRPGYTFTPASHFVTGPVTMDVFNMDFDAEFFPSIDGDNDVDLVDVAILARQWLQNNCAYPDFCDKADIDLSGTVDITDLQQMALRWLDTN